MKRQREEQMHKYSYTSKGKNLRKRKKNPLYNFISRILNVYFLSTSLTVSSQCITLYTRPAESCWPRLDRKNLLLHSSTSHTTIVLLHGEDWMPLSADTYIYICLIVNILRKQEQHQSTYMKEYFARTFEKYFLKLWHLVNRDKLQAIICQVFQLVTALYQKSTSI